MRKQLSKSVLALGTLAFACAASLPFASASAKEWSEQYNEWVFEVTYDFNDGATYNGQGTLVRHSVGLAPSLGDYNLISCVEWDSATDECHSLTVKEGRTLSYVTVNGERHDLGEGDGYMLNQDTTIKYFWEGGEDEANVAPAEDTAEDNKAAEEVAKLVNKVIAGEEVEGVDDELKAKIVAAVEADKEIVVEVLSTRIEATDVASDAEKVEAILTNDAKVGAYYEVDVVVKIDNEVAGLVSKLGNEIALTLPIPENLPAVPAGHTRVFTIVTVHNGVAKALNTGVSGQNAIVRSSEFSTYALTYQDIEDKAKTEDELKAPNTGALSTTDENSVIGSFVPAVLLAIIVTGLGILRIRAKN